MQVDGEYRWPGYDSDLTEESGQHGTEEQEESDPCLYSMSESARAHLCEHGDRGEQGTEHVYGRRPSLC